MAQVRYLVYVDGPIKKLPKKVYKKQKSVLTHGIICTIHDIQFTKMLKIINKFT